MEVWLFGNPDLPKDAMPFSLIPQLQKTFPKSTFLLKDPLDEWDHMPSPLIIIDTVQGLREVTPFTSLDQFTQTPNVTMHDYDLYTQLAFLQKLEKLPPFTIIGIPMNASKDTTLQAITPLLRRYGV